MMTIMGSFLLFSYSSKAGFFFWVEEHYFILEPFIQTKKLEKKSF